MKILEQKYIDNIDITISLSDAKKVVLIEVSEMPELNSHDHNANIFCIDNNYNILWQIDSDEGLADKDSFVFAELSENTIKAHRFFGTQYFIDPLSGESKKVGWNK